MSCNNKDLNLEGSIKETTSLSGTVKSIFNLNGLVSEIINISGSVYTFITSLSARMIIKPNSYVYTKAMVLKLIKNFNINPNVKVYIKAVSTKFSKTNIVPSSKIIIKSTGLKNSKMTINFKPTIGKDAILLVYDDKTLETLDPNTLGFLDFGEGIRATVERLGVLPINPNSKLNISGSVFRYLKLEFWDSYQLQNMDNLTLSQIDEQIV